MRNTILLTAVFSIVFFLAAYFEKDFWLHPLNWIILGFFFCTSWFTNLLVEQGMANKGEKFILFYLTSVVVRLILALIFVTVILYRKEESKVLFLLNFFGLYLCFSLFEISSQVRNLRRFSRERG
jgi:O-antigen/teichoic acid export membrane protein